MAGNRTPRVTRAVDAAAAAATLGAAAATAHAVVNAGRLRALPTTPEPVGEPVSVCVPARDEAGRVGACVAAALRQRDVADLEVLVGDDGSTDATAAVARQAAGGDGRLRCVDVPPPPAGWHGKPHACWHLARRARGSVLVFCDADVVLAPEAVAASVAVLRRGGLALLSPYPRLLADGWLPRLVQPLLPWSWLTFLPLAASERSARPSLTAAGGQLLVVDAGAYRSVGGHTAVAGEVLEDLALARRTKAAGRVAIADGSTVASCRMYDDAAALVAGYAKSLAVAFGSPARAAACLGMLGWLYVLPPAAAVWAVVRRRRAAAAVGAVGYVAGVVGRVVTARATRGRIGDAWAHPAGVLTLAALTAESLRRRRAGRATWKGRRVA